MLCASISSRIRFILLGVAAFFAADIFAQTYPFFDGFESGSLSKWTVGTGTYTRTVTNTTAATGAYSLLMLTGGNSSHYDGISTIVSSTGQMPATITFAVRTASTATASGYVVLRNSSTNILFFYMNVGRFYLNSTTAGTYAANTWYRVKIEVNWTTYTADCYVDNVKIISSVALSYSLPITNCCLYNFTSGSQAWWDDINIGGAPVDSTHMLKLIPVTSPTFNRRPVLRWNHNDSVSTYKLTIGLSPSFDTPLITLPTTDTAYQPAIDLPFDSIYWKLEDYSTTAFWSPISSFLVADSLQPVISLTPGSLKVTSGDTITKTLSICNTTGKRPLTWVFSGASSDTTRILVWTYGTSATGTQYYNLLAAIRQYNPRVTFTNYTGLDSATLKSALSGKSTFLIPEQDGSTISYTYGTILRNVLTEFVNNGGAIVCCYPYASSMYSFLTYAGLVNMTYAYYTSSGYSMVLRPTSSQLMSGITSLTTMNATSYFTVTGADTANVLATYSSYGTVFQKTIGRGGLVVLGPDFNTYDSSWAKILSRAVSGGAGQRPSWLSITPDTGTVAIGQCATVKLRFDPSNLPSGVYTSQLALSHNAVVTASPLAVPCTLSVPKTTMTMSPLSYTLTLNTGDSASRNLTVTNTGAAKLDYAITGSASGGAILINELAYDESLYDEIMELWNRGGDQNMTGWRVTWVDNVASSGSYTFPAGYVFKSGRLLSCIVGSGTNTDSTLYVGTDIAWVDGSQVSVALYDASGNAVDFVKTSGSATVTPSGTVWKGPGVTCSAMCSGIARNSNNDNDTASDWTPDSLHVYSVFKLNPGQTQVNVSSSGGWLSVASNRTGTIPVGGSIAVGLKINAANMLYSGVFIDSLIVTHTGSNYTSPFAIKCTLTVVSNIPAIIPYKPNPTSNRRPQLKWHKVTGATSYTIQIGSDAAYVSTILLQPLTDTAYLPAIDLPIGSIYWKVKSDLNATFSMSDHIIIQNDSIPTIIPVVPDTTTNRRPMLAWHKASGAAVYRVQIDTIGNFATPWLSTLTSDTSLVPAVNLPYGKIFWRVSNYTFNETAFSAVDTFWVKNPSTTTRQPVLPVTFAIGNAWPNPFIGSTAIPVAVPLNNQKVSVRMYDARGRMVSEVVYGPLSAGYHTVVLSAKENGGREITPGYYLCRISSGKNQKTLRLIKMK